MLWWLDLDDPAALTRADAVAPLPGEAAAFARHPDAGERLVRRRLARLLLAGVDGCRADSVEVVRTAAGAPRVATPAGWFLSVAGRWPVCLIGVARVPLGVDLERVEPDLPPALDLLTDGERAQLELLPPNRRAWRFAALWAAKEAHAKWTGEPRRVDPALVDVEDTCVRSPWGRTQCWRHGVGRHVAALCL